MKLQNLMSLTEKADMNRMDAVHALKKLSATDLFMLLTGTDHNVTIWKNDPSNMREYLIGILVGAVK